MMGREGGMGSLKQVTGHWQAGVQCSPSLLISPCSSSLPSFAFLVHFIQVDRMDQHEENDLFLSPVTVFLPSCDDDEGNRPIDPADGHPSVQYNTFSVDADQNGHTGAAAAGGGEDEGEVGTGNEIE